jgi:hypothetical protein
LFDSFVQGKTMHQLKTPPEMPMESDCHKRYYETNKCMPIESELDEKSAFSSSLKAKKPGQNISHKNSQNLDHILLTGATHMTKSDYPC